MLAHRHARAFPGAIGLTEGIVFHVGGDGGEAEVPAAVDKRQALQGAAFTVQASHETGHPGRPSEYRAIARREQIFDRLVVFHDGIAAQGFAA